MSTQTAVIKLLADGAYHSGTQLGARLGISRAAISKAVQGLTAAGVDIECARGRGYRTAAPFVPLAADAITRQLAQPLAVEVHETAASTNALLLQRDPRQAHAHACLAELQTAGRGRRGREWLATPYHNIALSLAWRFDSSAAFLAGLSLAAGVAVREALQTFGATELLLKWPNDVLWRGRKLGGLLIDVRGESGGPLLVVIGVGINVRLAAHSAAQLPHPVVDLAEILQTSSAIDRNRLAALLIDSLHAMLEDYGANGFDSWRQRFSQHHALANRAVRVHNGAQVIDGVATGIDAQGALRVRTGDGIEKIFHAGEVSVREAHD